MAQRRFQLLFTGDRSLQRVRLLAITSIIALVNGLAARISDAIILHGLGSAISDLFGISIVVWGAGLAGCILILAKEENEENRDGPIRSVDYAVAGLAVLMALLPSGASSWMALSGLSLYILLTTGRSALVHQGAWILLALTIPMFWSRVLFSLFADIILPCDAILAAWLLGTQHRGNMVQFAGTENFFQIYPACSSLATISLAILCVAAFVRYFKRRWSWIDTWWCTLASLLVVVINLLRLTLLGLFPSHFELIHGPVGSSFLGAVILILIIGVGLYGTRHESLSRA